MHVALGVDGRERVDDLLVAARAERGHREHLGLPAREHRRAMRTRQDADLDGKWTDVLRTATVGTQILLGHGLAEFLLQDLLEDRGDLFRRERRALPGCELRDRFELQVVQPGLTLGLVGVAELGAQPLAEERRDSPEAARLGRDSDVFHLWLA